MVLDWLRQVLMRDLASLSAQLDAYPDEQDIWRSVPGATNSAGTLALHLAGNLQHYFGTRLGRSGYVRDRVAEFDTRDLTRAELLRRVEDARLAVQKALQVATDESLELDYPEELGGVTLSTGQFLVHLAGHLSYHLGQLDYHRRTVTGEASVPGMQSIKALVSGNG
jgi:uncharacterized damage-inducible protein DinB